MCPTAKAVPLQLLALSSLITCVLLTGCSTTEINSLFDPNVTYGAQPVINSITPPGSAVAGIDTITIIGLGFSAVLSDNTVYLNAAPAVLLAATPTQITLKAPLVVGDSVGVRVAVKGSLAFSNTAQYALKAGVVVFGGLESNERSSSLCTDANGNLFAGHSAGGIEAGLIRFTPEGVRSSYAPTTPGVASWSGLKMGPGGYIYAARNFRAIYRFSPGGGSAAALWLALPTGVLIADIDFDQDGNVWGAGNGTNIYRLAPDRAVTTFPFVGNVRSVRVFGGFLYFAARTEAGEKIWRAGISPTGLGTPEVYFDFGSAYPAVTPLAITFSSDGFLYIGTNSPDGVVVVTPAKSASAPFGAYHASFGTGVNYFAWGGGDNLYASTSNGILLRFWVRGKTGAPYFGSAM